MPGPKPQAKRRKVIHKGVLKREAMISDYSKGSVSLQQLSAGYKPKAGDLLYHTDGHTTNHLGVVRNNKFVITHRNVLGTFQKLYKPTEPKSLAAKNMSNYRRVSLKTRKGVVSNIYSPAVKRKRVTKK